jgi:hypothetical protein
MEDVCEWLIERDVSKAVVGHFKTLHRNFPGGTEPVSRSKIEPGNSWIRKMSTNHSTSTFCIFVVSIRNLYNASLNVASINLTFNALFYNTAYTHEWQRTFSTSQGSPTVCPRGPWCSRMDFGVPARILEYPKGILNVYILGLYS